MSGSVSGNRQSRKARQKTGVISSTTLFALALWSPGYAVWGIGASGRRLLDQNCPATYPVSFAGTCYLCPADYPFFYSRKCYTDQVSASTAGNNSAPSVSATSQPITDPPDSDQAATSAVPASQSSVPTLSGGSTTTFSCTDPSQILWNNQCYSCPSDHPFFSGGTCHSTNPDVSSTNPNSASAAAARQSSFGGAGRRLRAVASSK